MCVCVFARRTDLNLFSSLTRLVYWRDIPLLIYGKRLNSFARLIWSSLIAHHSRHNQFNCLAQLSGPIHWCWKQTKNSMKLNKKLRSKKKKPFRKETEKRRKKKATKTITLRIKCTRSSQSGNSDGKSERHGYGIRIQIAVLNADQSQLYARPCKNKNGKTSQKIIIKNKTKQTLD